MYFNRFYVYQISKTGCFCIQRALTDFKQDGEYTLIHIPLNLYPTLLQPILRILLPQPPPSSLDGSLSNSTANLTLNTPQQSFLNISITPIEASIVCHTSLSTTHFLPLIASLPSAAASTVHVSQNDFLILSVISAGLDAAGRVMELTSPLALAGIPIFFISTYYSDFILVPRKEKDNVVKALLARDFELSDSHQGQFVTARPRTSSRSTTPPPKSPPPSNLAELQTRAFETLKKRNVTPSVLDDLELVQCSGKEISPVTDEVYSAARPKNGRHRPTWLDNIDTRLYTCIVSALVSQPRFLSLTLAQEDPPSLLLDRNLLDLFGDTLVGDTEGRHIPIFLDLVSLPLEVTGIVCGVAGRLVEEMRMGESSELSYLSTARAGAVILPEGLSKRAVEVLEGLLKVVEK